MSHCKICDTTAIIDLFPYTRWEERRIVFACPGCGRNFYWSPHERLVPLIRPGGAPDYGYGGFWTTTAPRPPQPSAADRARELAFVSGATTDSDYYS